MGEILSFNSFYDSNVNCKITPLSWKELISFFNLMMINAKHIQNMNVSVNEIVNEKKSYIGFVLRIVKANHSEFQDHLVF